MSSEYRSSCTEYLQYYEYDYDLLSKCIRDELDNSVDRNIWYQEYCRRQLSRKHKSAQLASLFSLVSPSNVANIVMSENSGSNQPKSDRIQKFDEDKTKWSYANQNKVVFNKSRPPSFAMAHAFGIDRPYCYYPDQKAVNCFHTNLFQGPAEKYLLQNQPKSILMCNFCKKNRESRYTYTSHNLRDIQGKICCPVLAKYRCTICGEKGHTTSYCYSQTKKPSVIKMISQHNMKRC